MLWWWEGNGGIYQKLHYGRDTLVGILCSSHLLSKFLCKKISALRKGYQNIIFQNKIELTPDVTLMGIGSDEVF
jgi:hypothetical protein